MGFLRLLLALIVVIFHIHSPLISSGISSTAVHLFFVISGFYMALILNEKYIKKNGSYKLFIMNRFLRIFPLYWIILALAFGFSLVKLFLLPNQSNYIFFMNNALSNSFYPTIDLLVAVVRNISLIIIPDYFFLRYPNLEHLLIPLAWSLQIELLFYLIAPWLVRLRKTFLSILVIIFSIITFGFGEKILPYETSILIVFFTKFIYFLLGIVSYHLYKVLKSKKTSYRVGNVLIILIPIFLLIFGEVFIRTMNFHILQKILLLIYFLIFTISIAYIFSFTKENKKDRMVGELSYPVYLSHPMIIKLVLITPLATYSKPLFLISCIALTLLFSAILVKMVEVPIDRMRHKLLH